MNYTFFHVDTDCAVPMFDLACCDGEVEVQRRVAGIFAEHRRCQAVEVWEEGGRTFTVERTGLFASPASSTPA